MKYCELHDGGRMPALGLGTWKSEPGEVGAAVIEALRLGFRHIDCAAIYGNEAEIGEALRRAFGDGLVKREDLWITSKLWNDAHLEADVRPALERTLRDLQLDALDLYLMHWPVALNPDKESGSRYLTLDEAPLGATWRGLEACVDAGLTRYIGVSNFSWNKIADLLAGARIQPAANQVEMHPYLQQQALVDACRTERIVVTAYSPLGSPDRPEGFKRAGEPSLLANPVIEEIAAQHDAGAGQVLIAWAIQRGTSVIPKSVNPERLAQNIAAVDLELSVDAVERIDALEGPFRFIDGTFWCGEGSPYTLAELWNE